MEAIVRNLRVVWDLLFAREVLLVGATAILTHFFDVRKLKKSVIQNIRTKSEKA